MFRVLFVLVSALCAGSFAELLNANFGLKWKISEGSIVFDVEARTLGWVGLGFNDRPKMAGADMAVGGVRGGQGYIYDLRASTHDLPQADSSQDYEILQARENGTHTAFTVRRKLVTGDKEDKPITGEPIFVLWAIGAQDAQDIYDFDYHSNRGYSKLSFNA